MNIEVMLYNRDTLETIFKSIDISNLNNISNIPNIVAFRIYKNINDKNIFSNWVYFGDKLSINELEELSKKELILKYTVEHMNKYNFKYVCHTKYDTYIPINDNDIVYDEYTTNKNKISLN